GPVRSRWESGLRSRAPGGGIEVVAALSAVSIAGEIERAAVGRQPARAVGGGAVELRDGGGRPERVADGGPAGDPDVVVPSYGRIGALGGEVERQSVPAQHGRRVVGGAVHRREVDGVARSGRREIADVDVVAAQSARTPRAEVDLRPVARQPRADVPGAAVEAGDVG